MRENTARLKFIFTSLLIGYQAWEIWNNLSASLNLANSVADNALVVFAQLTCTIIPRVRVRYELAIIISYPTSASEKIKKKNVHKVSRILSNFIFSAF